MPYTAVKEHPVHYAVAGSGPGVVFVHGTGAGGGQWAAANDALAGRFTIVAPDLWGSGATSMGPEPPTVGLLAEQVVAAAEHAALGPFHLVGHSLGAVVAAHLAGTRPELVRSLVLHAGWARSDRRMRALFGAWEHLHEADPRLLVEALLLCAVTPAFWNARPEGAFAAAVDAAFLDLAPGTGALAGLNARVQLDALDAVASPTLVLSSAEDQIVPPEHQQQLAAGIATSTLQWLRGGHGAPLEAPGELLSAIAAFLDAHADRLPGA